MANTIKLKRSSTASDTPAASDLEVGELAINTADAKLFTKHTDNSIKEISGAGGGGSSVTLSAINTAVTTNTDSTNIGTNSSGGYRYNTAFGYNAGASLDGTGSTGNTIFGAYAGDAITTGNQNTALGMSAAGSLTTGYNNCAIGRLALFNTTTGYGNVSIGFESGENVNGTDNVGVGTSALQGASAGFTGDLNVALGYRVMQYATTASLNTIAGSSAGRLLTTGSSNTFLGPASGSAVTTGSKNVFLGSYDGNQGGLDLRISSNNIVLSDGDANIRQYIDSNGNVGISNTSPSYKLDVAGDINFTGSLYQNGSAFSGGGGGSSNLTGLSDVNITSVADGDLLRYNGTASEWQNTNLGLTVTPTFTIPTTSVPSNASTIPVTVTNHTTLQADDVHYSATIKRSSDNAVMLSPTSTSVVYSTASGQHTGTITFNIASTFSSANEGTSYYVALTAQTFGDLQSEVATQTFTIVAPPQVSLTSGSYRYYRLADFAAQVFLVDWRGYTGINQSSTEYPGSNATLSSWSSDGQTNSLTASYYYSATYAPFKAMDSGSTTGWWTLGNNNHSTHTLTWDLGTARTLKSFKVRFNDRYTSTVSSGDNAFIVQGSNDNTNWTTIATVTASDEDFDASGHPTVYTTVLLSDTS